MKLHRSSLALALCIGVGMIAISATPAVAQQERGNQSREQHGGHKATAGHKATTHENKGHQRPQQTHAQRPQAGHAQPSRPAANHARPATNHARPQPGRPANNHGHAKPQPNRRPVHTQPAHGRPNYQFRNNDRNRLRQYYQGRFGKINRGRRPHFYRGGYIPLPYRTYIQPVPYSLIGYLPPVPPGYALGYYDGYVVVYNPATYVIVSVLNLLQ